MTDSPRPTLATLGAWAGLGVAIGVLCGAASALFLHLLDAVTAFRERHVVVVHALPLAGIVLGLLYERLGKPIASGSDLVIDTIHDDAPRIPLRLAPMVLGGTLLTHAFGGSAGREGTAVQMGASLADHLAHRLSLPRDLRRHVVAAGVAGGFGSVFGTPFAGAVFGLEFVVLGTLDYAALLPATIASVTGDLVTRALGVEHSVYPRVGELALTAKVALRWLPFAVAVGAAAAVFIEAIHALRRTLAARVPRLPLRLFAGGAIVVILWRVLGTDQYLGLGVPTILRAFTEPLPAHAFAAKLLFTVVTVGSGFIGGEVTPLFFMGATLGNALAGPLGLPLDLAAGVGLAALFGAASNAPLALSVMAAELLGTSVLPHVVLVSAVAYLVTGNRSIYQRQLRALDKRRLLHGTIRRRGSDTREP